MLSLTFSGGCNSHQANGRRPVLVNDSVQKEV
jgi:hypothetical protein